LAPGLSSINPLLNKVLFTLVAVNYSSHIEKRKKTESVNTICPNLAIMVFLSQRELNASNAKLTFSLSMWFLTNLIVKKITENTGLILRLLIQTFGKIKRFDKKINKSVILV
jgi:hypothetical protein